MSLYIFNFKKFFLVTIISFFFFILLFILGSELIIRNFAINEKNNYELVKTKLLNVKKNYAMFADSRGVSGLVENENFVNLSIRGINLKSIIRISEYYSNRNNLKGIILQLDPHQFSSYRLSKNEDDLISDLLSEENYFFYIFRPQYSQYLSQYWRHLPKKVFNLSKDKEIENKVVNKSNPKQSDKTTSIRVSTQTPLLNYSKTSHFSHLKKSLINLKSKNFKICLISFPVNSNYINHSNKNEIFKEIKNTFVTFSKQQQVIYKDFSQSMNDEFFDNSDHLNKKGAIIFTKIVLRHCFGELS